MKKAAFSLGVVGLGLLAAACSGSGQDDPAPFGAQDQQASSLAARLEGDLGAPVYVAQENGHTFAMPQGATRVLAPRANTDDVRAWIERYRLDLGVREGVSLGAATVGEDSLGLRHVSFTVGIPDGVAPGGRVLDVILDEEGRLVGVVGEVPALSADLKAKLTPEEARLRMAAYVAADPALAGVEFSETPTLRVVDAPDGAPMLVYEAALGSTLTNIVVSALDGSVSVQDGMLMAGDAAAVASYLPTSRFKSPGHKLSVDYQVVGSKVALTRVGNPGMTEISTFYNYGFGADYHPLSNQVTSDAVATFDSTGNVAGEGKGSAVDAHHWVSAADTSYRRTFGQGLGTTPKFGDKNKPLLKIEVHRNDNAQGDGLLRLNAGYHGPTNTIYLGDGGDGGSLYPGRTMLPPAMSIDVMGHETAHIVLDQRGLGRTGQEGILQEGLADVYGKLFEFEQLQQISNPKIVGATLFEDGRGIRDLARPSRVPGTKNTPAADSVASRAYACPTGADNGCVHARASVIGHAFYLMTFGGRNATSNVLVSQGVDVEFSRSLWQALLPKGNLLQVPRTILAIAQAQVMHSLRAFPIRLVDGKLTVPFQVTSVACAWEAVGVLGAQQVLGMTGGLSLCAKAGAEQPCMGRPDGTYCDTERDWAGFRCSGGTALGLQCATSKKCAATGPKYQDRAMVHPDGSLQCD